MARPAKATVDYFPHYVSGGQTLFTLESRFGNDGYAFWFKLLEILGNKEGHAYDCGEVGAFEYLCARARVTEDKANEILELLAKLQAIDTQLWEHRIIWVQNLVDNLADAYRGRKCPLPQKPRISAQHTLIDTISSVENQAERDTEGVSNAENPQIRVEQNKTKESKEDTSSDDDSADDARPAVAFGEDTEEYQLALYLKTRILSNKPDAMVPKTAKALDKWALEINRIIRINNRDPERIRAVIDWCQSDSFWLGNILSPGALRKHWDKMELQMQRGGMTRGVNGQHSGEGQRKATGDRRNPAGTQGARSDALAGFRRAEE